MTDPVDFSKARNEARLERLKKSGAADDEGALVVLDAIRDRVAADPKRVRFLQIIWHSDVDESCKHGKDCQCGLNNGCYNALNHLERIGIDEMIHAVLFGDEE